jgi:hypothetical protein
VDNSKLPPIQQECKDGKGDIFESCAYSQVCLGCRTYDFAVTLAEKKRVKRDAEKNQREVVKRSAKKTRKPTGKRRG